MDAEFLGKTVACCFIGIFIAFFWIKFLYGEIRKEQEQVKVLRQRVSEESSKNQQLTGDNIVVTERYNSLKKVLDDDLGLSCIVDWYTDLEKERDVLLGGLRYRAPKAAETVSKVRQECRKLKEELVQTKNLLSLYKKTNIDVKKLQKMTISQALRQWKDASEDKFFSDKSNDDQKISLMQELKSCVALLDESEDMNRKHILARNEDKKTLINLNATISSHKSKLTQFKEIITELETRNSGLILEIDRLNNCIESAHASTKKWKEEHDDVLLLLNDTKAWLPSVVRWYDAICEFRDNELFDEMKYRGAWKSSEVVAETKRENRKLRSDVEIARNFVDAYEAIAPWLRDSVDCTLDELLEAKKEEEKFRSKASQEEDPSRSFLSAEEYQTLSEVEKHQRALDRYWSSYVKRNLWLIGIQYERYVGYLYESKGFSVDYQGAVMGKDDLGIDLIAKKGAQTHIIQCKRYSSIKKIPVRENSVAQIYGAAMAYKAINSLKSVKAVLYTSFELSSEGRDFANALKVETHENIAFEQYPCIKCNIAKDGERIYHLPFDQMYDRVKIDQKGEFYANTIQEAHLNGFRRAYKWRGGGA